MVLIWLVSGGLTAAGGLSLWFGVRRYSRSRSWSAAAGVITGSRMYVGGMEPDTLLYPTVRYTTAEGTVHEVASQIGDNMTYYRPGRTMPVRYDPAEPTRMVLDTFAQNGSLAVLVGVLLLLFGLAALGLATLGTVA